jgi:hypothetical protein
MNGRAGSHYFERTGAPRTIIYLNEMYYWQASRAAYGSTKQIFGLIKKIDGQNGGKRNERLEVGLKGAQRRQCLEIQVA